MASVPRRALAAIGLLKPAFRLREQLRALAAPRPPPTAPDGLPLPSRLRMVRVVGHADWRQFYETGRQHAAEFARLAEEAGAPLSQARALLDWGCGCGRVTRHLPTHSDALILGRDPDPLTVGWAARHLPGDFRSSTPSPPLDLTDAAVDAVISLSVFTHLSLGAQRDWLAELARVTRPGGLLLLTFMDEVHHNVGRLGAARTELATRGFAVTTSDLEGTNHMATFQTRDQLTSLAKPWFSTRLSRSSRETSLQQAVLALIRK